MLLLCSVVHSFIPSSFYIVVPIYSHLKSSSNLASLPFSHFRDTRAALSYTQLCFTSISGYCSFNPGSQYYTKKSTDIKRQSPGHSYFPTSFVNKLVNQVETYKEQLHEYFVSTFCNCYMYVQ